MKKFLKLSFITIAIIVILAVGGYFVWQKVFFSDQKRDVKKGKKGSQKAEKCMENPNQVGAMFPLEPFIVNLNEPDGKRYLRASIILEFNQEEISKELQKELEKKLPQVRDVILTILSSKSFSDIHTLEGKTKLRNQLVDQAGRCLLQGKITNLYFTEFVIQ